MRRNKCGGVKSRSLCAPNFFCTLEHPPASISRNAPDIRVGSGRESMVGGRGRTHEEYAVTFIIVQISKCSFQHAHKNVCGLHIECI